MEEQIDLAELSEEVGKPPPTRAVNVGPPLILSSRYGCRRLPVQLRSEGVWKIDAPEMTGPVEG